MCGIAGFIDLEKSSSESRLKAVAGGMADSLRHRGPDDSGVWADERAGLALGFRRLAILDLTPSGKQPMMSQDGRYVIAFNGEIYNHGDVYSDLPQADAPLRGRSDTEVMLRAFSYWGVEDSLRRFNGMFALALWDRKLRRLYLIRDRLGEKPLYYCLLGGFFLFGSELKALKAHPAFKGEIDRDSLAQYLMFNCIHAPRTIYKSVFKLPPGCLLTLDAEKAPLTFNPRSYWSASAAAKDGLKNGFQGGAEEAVNVLDPLLKESVRSRMSADVPLGAFLSGGIDSSTVAALMQAQSATPIRTFTIGFSESDYDEAPFAKKVAAHLGTEHTQLYVSPEDARSVIPKLPSVYDEPFSDSSQIPTLLISQLARRHVTVSLTGDGGDELFGGYNRYRLGKNVWTKAGWLPLGLRRAAAGALRALSPADWNGIIGACNRLLPAKVRQRSAGDKLHKFAEAISAESAQDMYNALLSHWKDPASVVLDARGRLAFAREASESPLSFTEEMMLNDAVSYLPDDILVKLDRASMSVGLEGRAPFLDHRVFEFAWKLPLSLKIHGGQGKWILRQVLKRYVPENLIDRPKMGFGVPIDEWLRGPLRDWAESLLDEGRLKREGFLRPEPIRRKWAEHLSTKRNWQYHLWDVLMFQAWLEQN